MPASPIDAYRRQMERELEAGNATEHIHRPALKTLVESLAPGVMAINEPKRLFNRDAMLAARKMPATLEKPQG